MSFKVTLRKNGRPVGEMCYPSEAVAVSQAAAMTEAAPGTTTSVSTATKSNPRRKGKAGFTISLGLWGTMTTQRSLDAAAKRVVRDFMNHDIGYRDLHAYLTDHGFGPQPLYKSNPRRRRNGTVLWTPQGPAYEAKSPTRWSSVEIESRNGGKTYEVVAYGYADGREVRSVRAFGSKTPEMAQKYADKVRRELRLTNPRRNAGGGIGSRWEKGDTSNEWTLLLDGEPVADLVRSYSEKWGGAGKGRVADASKPMFWTLVPWGGSGPSVKPCRDGATVAEAKAAAEAIMRGRLRSNSRRNSHICRNPGCDCKANPRRNPAEFAFDTHFSRLMTRDDGGIWRKAPHHRGGSPRAYLAQIEALVADGSMSTGTAALLRQQMRSAGFTTGAEVEFAAYVRKPRRRKNPARKKATDSYIFVEGKAPDGSYFGANYKQSQLPALYDALRAAGVQRVTLDETTEVDLTAARKNPRNGTWSAERMASLAQRAQFGRR